MKYLSLLVLLPLSACNSGSPVPFQYICINPAMPIQGVEFQSNSPEVKDAGANLQITTQDGHQVTLPKSLCMQVRGG